MHKNKRCCVDKDIDSEPKYPIFRLETLPYDLIEYICIEHSGYNLLFTNKFMYSIYKKWYDVLNSDFIFSTRRTIDEQNNLLEMLKNCSIGKSDIILKLWQKTKQTFFKENECNIHTNYYQTSNKVKHYDSIDDSIIGDVINYVCSGQHYEYDLKLTYNKSNIFRNICNLDIQIINTIVDTVDIKKLFQLYNVYKKLIS